MRHPVAFLLLTALALLQGAPARADPPPAPEEVAARVAEAVAAKDEPALRRLASLAGVDPWDVALALDRQASPAVVSAFAAAVEGPEAAGLLRLAADAERLRAPEPDLEAALAQTQGRLDAKGAEALLVRLAALPESRSPAWQVQALDAQGQLARALGRSEAASVALLAGGRLALRIGWLSRAASLLRAAAGASRAALAFDRMLKACEALQEVEEIRRIHPGWARATVFLGNAHGELGGYTKAIRYYRRALRAYRQHDDARGLAFTLANAGLVHQRRGNLHAALLTFEQGRDVCRASGDTRREAQFQVRLGNLEHALGQYERAERTQEQARALLGEATDRFAQATRGESLVGSGMALARLDEPEAALASCEEALPLFRATGQKQAELGTQLNIAELQSRLAREGADVDAEAAQRLAAQAFGTFEAVIDRARQIGDRYLLAHALRMAASARLEHGHREEALDRFAAALEVAEAGHVHEVLVRAHAGRALALLALGRAAESLAATREAVEVLAPLVQGFSAEVGARARSRHAQVFAIGLQAARQRKDEDAVFELLERGRAGALLEWLEGRDEIMEAIVEPALLEEEATARRALVTATRRQAAVATDSSLKVRGEAQRAYDQALRGVAAVVERIQAASQAAASLLYPRTASLRAVGARLDARSRLVLYSMPPAVPGLPTQPCLALVLGPAETRLVTLANAAVMGEAVDAVRTAVTDPAIPAEEPLARLRALLVEPLELPASLEQVIVSPDGALFEVPFCALFEKPRVSMAPSGTVLTHLHGLPRLRGQGVIAFGGPDYESLEHKPAGLLLPPLREAVREARAVGAPALTGKEAHEAAFVAAVNRDVPWRGIHVACHGLFDPLRPMHTSLALSRSPHDDGLLTLTDIFKLKVNAEVVILSACDTARGNVLPGDGLVGLARAFMTAGARRVVASLWKVPDVPSRLLMESFHAHWHPKADTGQAPLPAAEALRRAQRELVTAHPKWAHPYYWAAWQVWGRAD